MLYEDLLGIKFTPHGRNRIDGYDCYGIAIEVLFRNGIVLPDLYYKSVRPTEELVDFVKAFLHKIEKPEKNCLIEIEAYGNPSHVGVYIGDGLFIHTTLKNGCCIEPLSHYRGKILGYYNVNNKSF